MTATWCPFCKNCI